MYPGGWPRVRLCPKPSHLSLLRCVHKNPGSKVQYCFRSLGSTLGPVANAPTSSSSQPLMKQSFTCILHVLTLLSGSYVNWVWWFGWTLGKERKQYSLVNQTSFLVQTLVRKGEMRTLAAVTQNLLQPAFEQVSLGKELWENLPFCLRVPEKVLLFQELIEEKHSLNKDFLRT